MSLSLRLVQLTHIHSIFLKGQCVARRAQSAPSPASIGTITTTSQGSTFTISLLSLSAWAGSEPECVSPECVHVGVFESVCQAAVSADSSVSGFLMALMGQAFNCKALSLLLNPPILLSLPAPLPSRFPPADSH